MPLDFLEKLGVSVYHPFHREALMAWWFVPPRYEAEFFRVVEHIWNHPEHLPRLQSAMLAYFRTNVVLKRNYHEFHGNMRALLKSRQFFFEEEDCCLDLA